MSDAPVTAGLAAQPDPPPDRGGKPMPEGIAAILDLVAILAEYGRHLAATVEHRAVWRGFATIAQFFGTATLPVIMAHIQRGIMRAVALERVLLQRAARGRDLVVLAPRVHTPRTAKPAGPEPAGGLAAEAQPAEAQPAEAPPAQPPASRRPTRRTDEPLTLDNLPSMAQLEAEVRRRPIGKSIVDICLDLGVSPTLCSGPFWNQVFWAIRCYRGSFNNIIHELRRREKRFERDSWKHPKLALPEEKREGARRVLGFFIGEPPLDPFRPSPILAGIAAVAAPGMPITAAATGPP